MKTITVSVPATSANLGPGFDVLGVALRLYNEVQVTFAPGGTKSPIEVEGEGAALLPRDTENIVWQAMREVFRSPEARGKGPFLFGDFRIRLSNRIPLASGLGSSAAARLAGIIAADGIIGGKLSRERMLAIGTRLEGHPDNVVPALVGGLCASSIVNGHVMFVKLPFPGLKAVICHPDFGLVTEKSRKVLPRHYVRADAVFNVSRTALFLSALQSKQYTLLAQAMEDRFHQPYRECLIPGMSAVFSSALKAGAYGVSLSGAGPSIIALAPAAAARKAGAAMQAKWKQFNINSRCFVLGCDARGAVIGSAR